MDAAGDIAMTGTIEGSTDFGGGAGGQLTASDPP